MKKRLLTSIIASALCITTIMGSGGFVAYAEDAYDSVSTGTYYEQLGNMAEKQIKNNGWDRIIEDENGRYCMKGNRLMSMATKADTVNYYLKLPQEVTEIDDEAFNNVQFEAGSKIVIHEDITDIGAMTFYYLDEVAGVMVHPDNEFYDSKDDALYNKDRTFLIAYPNGKQDSTYKVVDSVEAISSTAFGKNENLQKLQFGENIVKIGSQNLSDMQNKSSLLEQLSSSLEVYIPNNQLLESKLEVSGNQQIIAADMFQVDYNTNDSDFVVGDITGDGYVGIEDVVYSVRACVHQFIPSDVVAIFPTVVEFQQDAYDINGDGKVTLDDTLEILKGAAGEADWSVGKHKITSSDKTDVLYRHDGEYVLAYVKVKKWMNTTIIYDNTKVEFEGQSMEGKVAAGYSYDNKELGFVNILGTNPFSAAESADTQYGTYILKFKKLTDSDDITFASCTGAAYIQDNIKEGETFTEAAMQYEDAVYKEGYVIAEKVSLEEAQRALKMSLKLMTIQSNDSWKADINEDGKVTLEDAQKYLRLALKLDEI